MKMQFWGVRGAVPTPEPTHMRYGGNTCCLALYGEEGELVILDAGTGFCQLGDTLMAGEFGRGRGEMVLLITHTHWDHILGLPFPGIVHLPGNQLSIYGPDSARGSLEIVYDGVLSPVYSPVYGLKHIGATHRFHPISTDPIFSGNLQISALPLGKHRESPIWAYRIDEGTRSLVYITDVRYADADTRRRAIAFAKGASVIVHSAPYSRHEAIDDYGHARAEDAIEMAVEAGAERLTIFHHAPSRTDDQLDELLARLRSEAATSGLALRIEAASEGPVQPV